ncbi:ribosome small subunit-dependent GTPase A [Macrococcus equipercicus]|uniref:Small ribosomal subunit biogenesis GTPase RsgA n=1 Tax=Macrococcus equipercicus TaxID=69967 RepID=A0A9Q9BNA2_9STAP|nr:ribosome small subunit-dependent GTPase A [Macrococcus equipercicus]UTH14270.1 ribosome small subunit-dependent GTPase A [Macrococcus equipercicus]
MNSLKQLGFTDEAAAYTGSFVPGRISTQSKGIYKVVTEAQTILATLPGKFMHTLTDPLDIPAVGDFVLMTVHPSEQKGIIEEVLPRKQAFIRQAAGIETKPQIISTNIDYAFLAMSCNDNFNVNRMQRFLIAARDSGAVPIILLTKADLADTLDKEIMAAELTEIAEDVPVFFITMHTNEHIDELRALLKNNKTATILGSSGIGKSTLINQLMGQNVMVTNDIRESDSKGKHTTTHRELLLLPGGGIIIDTPGMREFQLWSTGENIGLSHEFSDVEELIAQCRFNNCSHSNEPGCAVLEALHIGSLSGQRYDQYLKYKRELAYQERRSNQAMQQAEVNRWKKISKIGKQNRNQKSRS